MPSPSASNTATPGSEVRPARRRRAARPRGWAVAGEAQASKSNAAMPTASKRAMEDGMDWVGWVGGGAWAGIVVARVARRARRAAPPRALAQRLSTMLTHRTARRVRARGLGLGGSGGGSRGLGQRLSAGSGRGAADPSGRPECGRPDTPPALPLALAVQARVPANTGGRGTAASPPRTRHGGGRCGGARRGGPLRPPPRRAPRRACTRGARTTTAATVGRLEGVVGRCPPGVVGQPVERPQRARLLLRPTPPRA